MDRMDDVLTVDEVAELLRVKPVTVMRWQSTRGLPAAKIGNTTRYRKAAILEWLAEYEAPRKGEA